MNLDPDLPSSQSPALGTSVYGLISPSRLISFVAASDVAFGHDTCDPDPTCQAVVLPLPDIDPTSWNIEEYRALTATEQLFAISEYEPL
jgi:hypothetical protein